MSRTTAKSITEYLRSLSEEATVVSDDGDVLTRAEALARMLWKYTLGYAEKGVDDDGNETEERVPPKEWAIQLTYNRLEGKIPQAIEESSTANTIKDKVSDMAQRRLNALASQHIDPEEETE